MKLLTRIAGLLTLLAVAPVAMAAAAISVGGLLNFVIYLVIIGLIFWAIWWFVSWVGVPEPFLKIIRVVLGLFALVIVVNLLLGLAGSPMFTFN